jgi:hypothetical protein
MPICPPFGVSDEKRLSGQIMSAIPTELEWEYKRGLRAPERQKGKF